MDKLEEPKNTLKIFKECFNKLIKQRDDKKMSELVALKNLASSPKGVKSFAILLEYLDGASDLKENLLRISDDLGNLKITDSTNKFIDLLGDIDIFLEDYALLSFFMEQERPLLDEIHKRVLDKFVPFGYNINRQELMISWAREKRESEKKPDKE